MSESYSTKDRPAGLRLRAMQAPNLLMRGVRHPTWMVETIRGNLRRRREQDHVFHLEDYRDLFAEEEDAIATVSGAARDEVRASVVDVGPITSEDPSGETLVFAGRPELIRVAASLVRLLKPDTVVETGVAQGMTTAALLRMMDMNELGHLYSVDLPVLYASEDDFVGRLVPSSLRGRWTLDRGPSRKLLPAIVARVAPIDIFLHDADHSYLSQLEEYRTAWPHIRPGGVLLSDDIGNPAFPEFAESVRVRPLLVGDPEASSAIGLLAKPGSPLA